MSALPDARFASDNAAGVHPAVMAALAEANQGAALAYGADPWTARAEAAIRAALGAPEAEVRLVYAGTGANVLALRSVLSRVESALCGASAHLIGAETAAPEVVGGVQLLPVPVLDGKLTPDAMLATLPQRVGDHRPRPRLLSITQATERGTVYTLDELRALADVAHAHDLLLHVDGARLYNAAVALGTDLAAITSAVGVDVLSLGGTKNGLMGAEAVVFLRPGLARDAGRHRKQITQLASKMRFVAAQFVALLEGDLWRECAATANGMARQLAARVVDVPGVTLAAPVETNAVFARLPADHARRLQARYAFELWDPRDGVVRWMCAFDTRPEDLDRFVRALAEAGGTDAPPAGLE